MVDKQWPLILAPEDYRILNKGASAQCDAVISGELRQAVLEIVRREVTSRSPLTVCFKEGVPVLHAVYYKDNSLSSICPVCSAVLHHSADGIGDGEATHRLSYCLCWPCYWLKNTSEKWLKRLLKTRNDGTW